MKDPMCHNKDLTQPNKQIFFLKIKSRCKPKKKDANQNMHTWGKLTECQKKAINTVLTFENSSLGAWVQLLIEFHFGPHGPTLPGSTENGIYIITTWQMWPPLSF